MYDLASEIEHLRWKLRTANEEISKLKRELDNEQDSHKFTKRSLNEYVERSNRSYDAYVTDPHEYYIHQDDVNEMEAEYNERIAELERQNAELLTKLAEMERES